MMEALPSSEDGHSLAGDVSNKVRWSAWKRMTGSVIGSPIQHITADSKDDAGYDEGMWDNNDASFLREVAFEHQKQFNPSPSPSDNNVEEVSTLAGSSSGHTATQSHNSILQQTMLASPYSMSPVRRPTSAAGASLFTHRSLSASTSDASSAITYPSPGSSKVELNHHRNRLSGSKFADSYETSPTTASFSSREVKNISYAADKFAQGWTEEPIDPSSNLDGHSGVVGEILLTALPEEQSPDRFHRQTQRRPSDGNVQFSSSGYHTSPRRSSKSGIKAKASSTVNSEANPTTDYRLEKTPTSVKSSIYTSTTMNESKGSPTPTKKSSFVSGLKKKLGGTLRSTGNSKESSPELLSNTGWGQVSNPPPTTDEIQIVSAKTMSPITSPQTYSSLSAQVPLSPTSKHPYTIDHRPDYSLRERTKLEDYSMTGKQTPTVPFDKSKNTSIESFSNRLFNKNRSSGLFSTSRNSSRTSVIEQTPFHTVRRGSASSHQNYYCPPNQFGTTSGVNEEEREELQGDLSPLSVSQDLPSHQVLLRSPVRPVRLFDEVSSSRPSSRNSTRVSLENNFNAAHDARWSTAISSSYSERRGSDVSLTKVGMSRRGSDTSSAGMRRAQAEYRNRDSMGSMHSQRKSWQQNFSVDALVPGRKSSLSTASSASHSKSKKRMSLLGSGSPKWSEMIGSPLSRKKSLTAAQISRPTSVIGGSYATQAEDIDIGDNHRSPTSPTGMFLQKVKRNEEAEKWRGVPSPIQSVHPDLVGDVLRPSKSAHGRVERPVSLYSQGQSSIFLMQQQSRIPKRPTFGLDLQPDAAAAFDCIPSPHARRVRTSSTPTLVGLSPSNVVEGEGEYKPNPSSTSPNSDLFPSTPYSEDEDDNDADAVKGQEEEGEQELLLSPTEEKGNLMNLISTKEKETTLQSPRPLPADAPQSPTLDELELLNDEGGSREVDSRSTSSTTRNDISISNAPIAHPQVIMNRSPSLDQLPSSHTTSSPLLAHLPRNQRQDQSPWANQYNFSTSPSSHLMEGNDGRFRRASYTFV